MVSSYSLACASSHFGIVCPQMGVAWIELDGAPTQSYPSHAHLGTQLPEWLDAQASYNLANIAVGNNVLFQ